MRGLQRHVDRVGEARHDRGQQCADGGEQAGVDPMAARPAAGRQVLRQLPMQCAVVKDMETLLEALLARAFLFAFAVLHQGFLMSPKRELKTRLP